MGRTLKSASSHLPLISEKSDEIQETYLISVVCQRKNEGSKITPFEGGKWVTYETLHPPPSILCKIWEALSILWVWSTFNSLGLDVYATGDNPSFKKSLSRLPNFPSVLCFFFKVSDWYDRCLPPACHYFLSKGPDSRKNSPSPTL